MQILTQSRIWLKSSNLLFLDYYFLDYRLSIIVLNFLQKQSTICIHSQLTIFYYHTSILSCQLKFVHLLIPSLFWYFILTMMFLLFMIVNWLIIANGFRNLIINMMVIWRLIEICFQQFPYRPIQYGNNRRLLLMINSS